MTTLDTPRPAPSLPLEILFGLVLGSTVILALMTWQPAAQLEGLDYLLRRWHVPTVLTQAIFCAAAFLNPACRQALTGLTRWQGRLLALMFLYVGWRSVTAPYFGSLGYGAWWLVQIPFFAALLGCLRAGLLRPGALWIVAGVVAAGHLVCLLVVYYAGDWGDGLARGLLPPGFSHKRHPGYLMAAIAAAMAARHLFHPARSGLALALFAIAFFYIWLSGSRGALIALLAGLAVVIALRRGAAPGRLATLAAMAVAAALLSEVLLGHAFNTVLDRVSDNLERPDTMSSSRVELWSKALIIFQAHWLWGAGPTAQMFIDTLGLTGLYNHPHNVGLQVLGHWGVVGTALLAITAASFLARLRLPAVVRSAPVAAAVIAVMGTHALVDGGLYYPFSVALFLLAVAEVLAPEPRKS